MSWAELASWASAGCDVGRTRSTTSGPTRRAAPEFDVFATMAADTTTKRIRRRPSMYFMVYYPATSHHGGARHLDGQLHSCAPRYDGGDRKSLCGLHAYRSQCSI